MGEREQLRVLKKEEEELYKSKIRSRKREQGYSFIVCTIPVQ